MIKNLIKLANHLDEKGLTKEADYVDWIIKESAKKKKKLTEEEEDIAERTPPKDKLNKSDFLPKEVRDKINKKKKSKKKVNN